MTTFKDYMGAQMHRLRFVFALFPREHRWMMGVCMGMFILQACWEAVVITSFAVLLNSVFSRQGQNALLDSLGNSWLHGPAAWYDGLAYDQKVVFGFVLAAGAVFLKDVMDLGVFTFSSRVSTLYIIRVRCLMFGRLLRNRMSYFDNAPKGSLIQMVINEVRACYDVMRSMLNLSVYALIIATYVVYMLCLSKTLTAVVVVLCLALFQVIRMVARKVKAVYGRLVVQTRALTQVTDQSVGGVKQVKLLGFLPVLNKEFDRACWDNDFTSRSGLIWRRCQQTITILSGLVIFTTLAVLNWKGGFLSMGLFLTFLYIIRSLVNVLGQFNGEWGLFSASLPAMEKISQAFEDFERTGEKSGTLTRDPLLTRDIVFDRVTLDYGKGAVVQDFSLRVAKGQRVALVGESGSGKTSIINSLARLYDPAGGRITIDGTPLQEFDLDFLRGRIGFVHQDIFIFNRTVAENIRMGKPDASRDEIVQAATHAHAHEFITGFPEGYAAHVGDRGVKMSGGQRQRINIAQVFIKDTEILIFDEATSALDTKSEQAIQQVFHELGRDKTVFMVAHRLSTVRSADVICVMHKGKLVESGSWDALIARNGMFAAMVNSQSMFAQ